MPRIGHEDQSESGSGVGGSGSGHGLDRVSEGYSDDGIEPSNHLHRQPSGSSPRDQGEILIPGITSGPVEDVVGMHGRIRLARAPTGPSFGSDGAGMRGTGSMSGRGLLPSQTLKALDTQRHLLQAYEYLCHVGEAKQWLETVLAMAQVSLDRIIDPASDHLPAQAYPSSATLSSHPPAPPTPTSPSTALTHYDPADSHGSGLEHLSVVELEQTLRDGVVLAKLARKYMGPKEVPRVFIHPKLQYRHIDNINYFFHFVGWVGLPELFVFETTDLYNAKNLPKVIYCIHVLSHLLAKRGLAERIGNLVGKLEFSNDDLEQTNRGIAGKAMPNFGNINKELAKEINEEPEPEPEPEETEEERQARELAELEPEVVALQSQVRGFLSRVRMDHLQYRLHLAHGATAQFQAAARGALTRQRCAAALELRRSLDAWITGIQAQGRGVLARGNLMRRRRYLEAYFDMWAGLQAHIRGLLARRQRQRQQRELRTVERGVVGIQALVRAKLARQSHSEVKKTLGSAEIGRDVRGFQAQVRGLLARRRFFAPIMALDQYEAETTGLQAHVRGMLARRSLDSKLIRLEQCVPELVGLQAACRGALARRALLMDIQDLQGSEAGVTMLQAQIRGALARREYASKAKALERVEVTRGVGQLQAFARAALARKKVQTQKKELDFVAPDVVGLQAQLRGVMARREWSSWRDHVRRSEPTAVYLQALARGLLNRRAFYEKLIHYHHNVHKVVKIQSLYRGRQQADQYRQLIQGRNVPMSAIKNFMHLLNDSDSDYREEIEIERLRNEVVRSIRENQALDAHVNELDTKIALLVKNKITLDEVQRTRRQGGMGIAPQRRNSVLAAANDPFAAVALDKATQRKLELYQQFFYLLQTRPEYLARLFYIMGRSGMAEKAKKVVEGVVLTLFGYAQNRREEFLLLKLFQRSIHEELAGVATLGEFAKGNFIFIKLVVQYGRGAKERKYLRDLLSPVVQDLIRDDKTNLETDPVKIYRSVLNEEEMTGVLSQRRPEVTFHEALMDHETQTKFIQHLQALRALTDQFLWAITHSTRKMPFGIRYIAREIYRGLQLKYPDEDEENLMKVVSNMVYYRYLQPAVVAPETFDVVDSVISPVARKNLAEASKMLNQISVGRLFADDIPYLVPLNEYIQHASVMFIRWFAQLIDVEDAETHFSMDEFLDHTQSSKPTIYISPNEIYSTHSLILKDLDRIAPHPEDPLRLLLVELGGAPTAASAELDQARAGEIALSLENKLAVKQDPEAEAKALWVRTKRYVLAMLKVQPGKNLLEAFLVPVTPEHEEVWAQTVAEEIAEARVRKRASRAITMSEVGAPLEDVHSLSFQELKARTLEHVLALESVGKLSRADNYQGMLDSLANDILLRNRRRILRQGDMSALTTTLANLKAKQQYLEEQQAQYNNYINDSMASMQEKGVSKKRFVLPFTPQWHHMRTLEKEGRKPKFGSYKYSAQRWYEKGILLSIDTFSPKQFDRVSLVISCDEVGVFQIEALYNDMPVPNGKMELRMEDLLEAQFAGRQSVSLDVAKLNLNLLLYLINRKFYV